MAAISITTEREDEGATPSFSSSLSPGPRSQPQAISLATLNLPTANTARAHLGTKKKSESKHIHPGYSMFDWTRYTQTAGDLTGVGGQIQRISQEELAKHNTEEDAWTVVRGVVYNITPFMKYHPGGKAQLMRGAGNDCTQLFDKIHIWVNSENILQKCIVGVYTGGKPTPLKESSSAKQVDTPTGGGGDEPSVISLAVPSMNSDTVSGDKEEVAEDITLVVPVIRPRNEVESVAEDITLVVPTTRSRNEAEKGAESVAEDVTLVVPTTHSRNEAESVVEKPPSCASDSDYLKTTWNSVTGYETSV